MLAFGAVVGRRRQNNPWFAAKLRVGFAADGPFGMRYISTSRDRAATRSASPTMPNGGMGIYWYGPCSFDLTIQTKGGATIMKSIELLSTPCSPAQTMAARMVRHLSDRGHRHLSARPKA